jgi:hypothetical protein
MPSPPPFAVLVSSCDAYRDLWPPFFELLFRHWPAVPTPVHLGCEQAGFADPRVECLALPPGNWSTRLAAMLERVPADYVLLLLEDYLLRGPARAEAIHRLAGEMEARGADCLRLYPCPGPDDDGDGEIGVIARGAPFRVSLQAALWRRSALAALLVPGESPWEFERAGSRRSDASGGAFLSVRRGREPIDYFCTAVRRGRWLRDGVRFARGQGVVPDLAARPPESLAAYLRRRLVTRWRGCRIEACRRQCAPGECTRERPPRP